MLFVTLLIYIVLVVLLAYLAIWVIGQLAPSHPAIIDKLIWIVAVLIVVMLLMQAFGLAGGPRVPQLLR